MPQPRVPRKPSFTEEETAGLALPRNNLRRVDFEDADIAPPLPPKPARRTLVVTGKYDAYVLPPDHHFLLVWDIFICVLLFFQAWTVPFEVGVSGGFVWQTFGVPGVLYHLFLSLVFMLDTALCFFRSSRDHNGRLVWRLRDIRWHYLRGWFIVDLVSCVPVYSIAFFVNPQAGSASFHFLEVLQALRLLRITRITRHLKSSPIIVKFSLRFSQGSIQVVRISLVCVYVAHCMACTLCFMHLLEDSNVSWVHKYVMTDQPLINPLGTDLSNSLDRYILAMYWATTTMVSVGYGDVTPSTRAEYWVVSILVLISAALWAWVVAGLVDLVSQLEAESNQLKSRLAIINRVAAERRPSSDQRAWDALMDESRLYLQTAHWRTKNAQGLDALSAALEGLSHGLRQRILLSQSQESLLRVPYFASARASTAAYLASQMVNRNVWVGETVIDHANAHDDDRFLYFVRIGTCISVLDVDTSDEQEPRVEDVVQQLVDGTLAADVDAIELRRPGQRKTDISIVSQDMHWGSDNFCLEASSKLFQPARLKALTFCECLALPRLAFLRVLATDGALRAAVRWRIVKLAFLRYTSHTFRPPPTTSAAVGRRAGAATFEL